MTERTPSNSENNPFELALRELRGALAIVGVFSFVLNLLILVTPLYMFQVFDRVLTSGRTETLFYLTLIAIVGVAFLGILDATRSMVLARIGLWMEKRLSRPVLQHSLRNARHSGLLREYLQVQNFVGSQSVVPFFDLPWVPLFLIVMWLLHPALGILAVAAAFVITALAIINERLTRKAMTSAQEGQGAAIGALSQAARNADVISALNMSEALSQRIGGPLDTAQWNQSKAAERNGFLLGLIKFVRFSVQIAVLGIGAYLVLLSELSPGGMIAGSIILGRALAPIEQAVGSWRAFVGARSSFVQLRNTFRDNTQPLERTRLPMPKGHLRVDNVSFAPPGSDKLVLKQVRFDLKPGEVLGVVGPSGAGKSMLCRLISGIWSPQGGAIRLDEAEIDAWNREQFAAAIGYLPQNVELFAGTIKDNIARMGAPDDDQVVAAAKRAGAHDMILNLPDAYETLVGLDGGLLSAGERQRIGLARAVYGDPKLLILDEPNSNLDEQGERALIDTIRTLKQDGCAVVVAAHRRTILGVVDKLLFLSNGSVQNFGPRDIVLGELQERNAQRARQSEEGPKT